MRDRLIEIARGLAETKRTGSSFHVSFAVRGKRIIAVSINQYKSHPSTAHYKSRSGDYFPTLHSETALVLALRNYHKKCDIYIVRVMKSGKAGMSKPCVNCMELMNRFDNIFYTDKEGMFKKLL